MAFGAKVQLSVDKSKSSAFRKEIQNVINATPIKVTNIKIELNKGQQAQLTKSVRDALTASAKDISIKALKVNKIDAKGAVNDFRKQLEAMLNGLNIGGLKEFMGGGKATAATSQFLKDLESKATKAYRSGDKITNIPQATQITQQYQEISGLIAKAKVLTGEEQQAVVSSIVAKTAALQSYIDKLRESGTVSSTTAQNEVASRKQVEALYRRIATYEKANPRITSDPLANSQLQGFYTTLSKSTDISQQELKETADAFALLQGRMRTAGLEGRTFGSTLKGMFQKFGGWTLVTRILTLVIQKFKQMIQNVVALDTAMTELKKVTDLSNSSYDRLFENAISRAKTLGATITDVINATADFARLGYGIEDAEKLADAAIIYKNVGDGITDINAASESIISTMKAFGRDGSLSAMDVVDKFNEVGNNFAISSKGIGDALQRSSAALAAAGNTLDESIGMATGMNAILQDPEKVGTVLKTASMFLRAAKTEAEDAGESTEGMAKSISELRKELLILTNNKVDIMEDDGTTFKSTVQIYRELAQVWKSLADVDAANILELIGGKRNATANAAILSNFADVEAAIETSINSAGSATKENLTYLDSIAGRISLMKAEFEELSINIFDDEGIKTVVDLLTELLKILNKITDTAGSLSSIGGILGLGYSIFNKGQGKISFSDGGFHWGNGLIKVGNLDALTKFNDEIESGTSPIRAYAKHLQGVDKATRQAANSIRKGVTTISDYTQKVGAGTRALNFLGKTASAVGNALLNIGVSMAIGWVIGEITKLLQKAEELRKEQISLGEETAETNKKVNSLIESYRNLGKDGVIDVSEQEKATSIQEQLNELLGDQVNNINLANSAYDEQIEKLKEIQNLNATKDSATLYDAKTASETELLKSAFTWASSTGKAANFGGKNEVVNGVSEKSAIDQLLSDTGLSNYGYYTSYNTISNKGFRSSYIDSGTFYIDVSKGAESVIQSYEDMLYLKGVMVDKHKKEIEAGGVLHDFYNDLSERISELSGSVTQYKSALENYNINQSVIEFNQSEFNGVKGALIENQEQLDNWIQGVKSSTNISDELKLKLIELANQQYPEFSKSIKEAQLELAKEYAAKKLNISANSSSIKSLIEMASQYGITKGEMVELIASEITFNNSTLSVSQKVAALQTLAKQAKLTKAAILDINVGYDGETAYDLGVRPVWEDETNWLGKKTGKKTLVYEYNGKIYRGNRNETAYDQAANAALADAYNKSFTDMSEIESVDTDTDFTPATEGSDNKEENTPLKNYLKDAENKYKIHQNEEQYINDLIWAQNNLVKSKEEELEIIKKIDEAYRNSSDNQIKDIKHQIDIKKELYGDDYNATEDWDKIQEEAHAKANKYREYAREQLGYYNEGVTADEKAKIDEWIENTDEIQNMQNIWWDAQNNKLNWRFNNSKNWIEERNRLGDWNLFGDSEVEAWERVIKWLEEEYPNAIDEIKEAEEKLYDSRKEQFNKATDFANSYLDSHKTILQAHHGVINSIAEAQHEINKELEASMTMYEYLDEDTRKLLFNQEDYNKLSKELVRIENEAIELQTEYEEKMRNATLETVESITSEYEMQYETLMKSYEIAKADLEIAKKKQKLNNVLNERNVRMLINGEWQWVANTQDVIDAKSELADAEYAKRVAKSGLTQQESINNLTRQQNQLGVVINLFENGVIDLKTAVKWATGAIEDLPKSISSLFSKVGANTSQTQNNSSRNTSSSGGSGSSSQPKNNATAFIPGVGDVPVYINSSGKTETALPVGSIVHTGGGDYVITGGEAGNYTSEKIDKNAKGTKSANPGLSLINELKDEGLITNDGTFIPLANFSGGETVFNHEMMENLWRLAQLPISALLNNIPAMNKMSQIIEQNQIFHGDIIVNNPTDWNDFIRQLNTQAKSHNAVTNRM